jgi:hypothetical protein
LAKVTKKEKFKDMTTSNIHNWILPIKRNYGGRTEEG